jgi:hypothetical protein
MLLDDIINLATDDAQSITVLLRKCLILAHQLNNGRLKQWANEELNGYDSLDDMPEYRKVPAQAKGNFVGGWGAYAGNRNIPPAVMDKEHRWAAESVNLGQPVSAYEELIDERHEGAITFPWVNNMVLYYQHKFIHGYALVSAWQEVPRSAIVGLLDTIRTRILNMALELRSEIGSADEDLKTITPEESKKADQSIVNNIFGGNVYMSTGNSTMSATTVQQEQQNIAAGDWEHLSQVLQSVGVSKEELDELSRVAKEDGGKLGPKIKGWIAKTAPQVVVGGVKMAASIGITVLTEYMKQYYGLK